MRVPVRVLMSIFLTASMLGGLTAGAESPALQTGDQRQEATAMFTRLAQSENPYIASFARENLERLASNKIRVEVPLVEGDCLTVPVMMKQDHQRTMANFIVDTGASYTVISPEIASALGIKITRDNPRVPIITANGQIEVPVVTIPEMTIGKIKIRNVEAVVQDLGNDPTFSGLLGIAFFKDMNMQVQHDRLILEVDAREISAALP